MSTNPEPMVDVAADPGRPGLGMGEGFIAPRPRRKFPTQAVILFLVVGVSGAALYAMRHYGTQAGFKFDDAVEVNFKPEDEQKAKTYQRIMEELARVQKPLDVALGDFGKSPFMLENTSPTAKPDFGPITQPGATEQERKLAAASTALKQMHLNSIIGNIARIDEQNYRVGDVVADIFTVKAVDGRTVTFTAYDQEFTLTMEIGKSTSPKKSPAKMGNGPRR